VRVLVACEFSGVVRDAFTARGHWDNQTPSGQNKLSPGPRRAKDRARTYEGIAVAMAEQWGCL
jgi:hypothetical protein